MEVRIGGFQIDKPLLLWINDGLMALFFLLVGLELKREFVDGELSDLRAVALPAVGALGGMAVPAAIYVWENLSLSALVIAGACLIPLWILNRRGVMLKAPYLLIGVVMWAALLKSGVHATLAGVVLALLIPLRPGPRSPAEELEHDLHSAVAYGVLPLFAFANAGLTLSGLTFASLLHPVPLGIMLGLFLGKQAGIFGLCSLAVRAGMISLPAGMTWTHVYGTALLCGVGFTMSLFIGSLAFEETGVNLLVDERIGILSGSLLSGVAGYLFLRATLKPEPADSGEGARDRGNAGDKERARAA